MTKDEEIKELHKFIDEYCRPTIKELRAKNEDLHIDLAIYRIAAKAQNKITQDNNGE